MPTFPTLRSSSRPTEFQPGSLPLSTAKAPRKSCRYGNDWISLRHSRAMVNIGKWVPFFGVTGESLMPKEPRWLPCDSHRFKSIRLIWQHLETCKLSENRQQQQIIELWKQVHVDWQRVGHSLVESEWSRRTAGCDQVYLIALMRLLEPFPDATLTLPMLNLIGALENLEDGLRPPLLNSVSGRREAGGRSWPMCVWPPVPH